MSDAFGLGAPPPAPDLESAPFWDACRNHELIVKTCRSCGRAHFPPGPICPWCASFEVTWTHDPGRGTVHSHITFRHPFVPELTGQLPYTVLRVRLDAHPDAVLYGRLVGAPVEAAHEGLAVEVEWEDRQDGWVLPDWRPAAVAAKGRPDNG